MSGLYDLWRVGGYNTYYPPRKTAVTADVLEIGIIYAILIIAFSFIIIIPGVRGRERLYYTIRVVIGLFILGCILLVNFGQEWEVAALHDVPTQYRAGLREEIHADIEVKIGLRSINITLKTDPEVQEFDDGKIKETINFNERFSWNNLGWTQGRVGFGPYAGLFNQQYRAAQLKGLPYPILWIAEYFTIDGEYIRWGRFYRQAGFYAHMMIWTAFPLWILTMIFFKMVLRYGGYFSMLTGLSLISANLIYAFVRNPLELVIPFGEDHKLTFSWGWSFWLCLVNGILSLIIGIVVVIMDIKYQEKLATFFDFDISLELEEFYADPAELQSIHEEDKRRSPLRQFTQKFTQKKQRKYIPREHSDHGDENANANGEANVEYEDTGAYSNPNAMKDRRHFRKKTMVKSVAVDNTRKQERPKPAPRQAGSKQQKQDDDEDDDEHNYTNVTEAVVSYKAGQTNVGFEDAAES